MSQDTRTRFIFIVILTAVCAYIVAPIPNKPKIPFLSEAKLKKGIDLAGGAELRYRVLYDPGETDKAKKTRDATEVIRRRVEAKQLKEPKITSQGEDQIIIQLAEVDQEGLKDYKRLIEQAGKLELHAVANKDIQEAFNRDKKFPEGYMPVENTPEHKRADPEYEPWSKDQVLVQTKTIIDGRNIVRSEPAQEMAVGGMRWVTSFELDQEGSKAFDEAAKILFHQRPAGQIAIMLDGRLRSAPSVQSESFRGRGQISGAKDENDAKELSIILRSGSLPAPIGYVDKEGKKVLRQPEAETFVGPTLGQDAIRRGLWASGLTIGAVALFMLVYYRTAGWVAVVSVALNLVYLLAIMSFFQATMTLPGIAGIVLTVGMAVDANILIYERIREEQARGKSASQAFEAAHERALSAIVDSNITTLLAGVVLYYFGTGPVQGFAITLSIGILTTLFSVLFCAKVFLKMMIVGGLKEFKMMRLLTNPNVNFIGIAKACVLVSTLAVVGGTSFFFSRGEKNFGIDFRGGTMLAFAMTKEQDIEEIRSKITTVKGPDGLPKYADAEVQTVANPEATRAEIKLGGRSRNFQLRTSFPDVAALKQDIENVFKDRLSHEPFEEMKPEEVDPNPRVIEGRPAGIGWNLYVLEEKCNLEALRKKIAAPEGPGPLFEKNDKNEPLFQLREAAGAPPGLKKLHLSPTKSSSEREGMLRGLREKLKEALKADLAQDPFLAQGTVGPTAASELRDSTVWAMVISWALMIVYIAIRFASWRYGAAAVIALIHDALLSIAFTSLAGALIPRSWGLSFDMNLTTLAAILTVIGYSVNDTIVVFDRIRENLILMKKNTFQEVINASVNQTMSRTILTSFTVWISATVLYVFTATTGGGIAEFSFPLIVGVIVGTYSSIYIASPVVLWWYRGQRPQAA